MTTPQVIETFSLVAPLGLCFHDAATGEKVNGGLSVCVYPEKTAGKNKMPAFPNRVGVYVLHKAYGLGIFPSGEGGMESWDDNPPESPPKNIYVVEVLDTEKRFQPFRFTVKLPVRGIYKWENIPVVSPNKTLPSVPLYSAPTRKVAGGMSVIRAELREKVIVSPDISEEKPASFAVLEARFEGNLAARGIADKNGQIVLIFPSLSPQSDPLTSPPASATQISLADQQWLLDLTVKYQPSPPMSGSDEEIFPDLRLALAQAKGKLWEDAEQTEEYKSATLHLGKELILRSRAEISSPPLADLSFIFVSPAP